MEKTSSLKVSVILTLVCIISFGFSIVDFLAGAALAYNIYIQNSIGN